MILWLALFLLVIAISFVLAFQSMRDYQNIPQQSKAEYGLFLIRQTEKFDSKVLDSIREILRGNANLIVSMERLFRGSEAALTIFGPKKILDRFASEFSLLELEDYTQNLESQHISVWEVGVGDASQFKSDSIDNVFNNLPVLTAEEQFFWQIVVGGDQIQIRAAVYSKDPVRRQTLVHQLQNLASGQLIKIPKPFSSEQMITFYRLRSLSRDSKMPVLNSEGIIRLLKVI
ncbi:hypothetical protein HYU95_00205 [Candidatus Daviesbacteria bacterium]|nr:hypothetical protein [Candidatus Daviesbacteria bacterium]